MAKNAYIGVSSTSHTIKNLYVGVSGVSRKIKCAYIGVSSQARLWWKSELTFSKTITNPNSWMHAESNRWPFFFCNNGTYLIATAADSAFYINANDVAGTLTNDSNYYGMVASSGSKVWYLDGEGDYFCYYDTNLVSGKATSAAYIQVDYNMNYGGGSFSYQNLGIATFFDFYYPRDTMFRLYENGTMNRLDDAFGNGPSTPYHSYIKNGSYIVMCGSYIGLPINVSSGVILSTIAGGPQFPCMRCEAINGTAIVLSGSPANSETKAYSLNSNLVFTEFSVPTEYSELPLVYYDCVSYNGIFYYYIDSNGEYPCFSIDSNHLFKEVESPEKINAEYSANLGHDIFNNSVYVGLKSGLYLNGLLKGN